MSTKLVAIHTNWYSSQLFKRNITEKRTIPRLLQAGFIHKNLEGESIVLDAPISRNVAKMLSFLVVGGCSWFVYWLIFVANPPGFLLIIQAFGVGLVTGTLITFVHDFSYTKEDIFKYLENKTHY